jgi:hypothetical protein
LGSPAFLVGRKLYATSESNSSVPRSRPVGHVSLELGGTAIFKRDRLNSAYNVR